MDCDVGATNRGSIAAPARTRVVAACQLVQRPRCRCTAPLSVDRGFVRWLNHPEDESAAAFWELAACARRIARVLHDSARPTDRFVLRSRCDAHAAGAQVRLVLLNHVTVRLAMPRMRSLDAAGIERELLGRLRQLSAVDLSRLAAMRSLTIGVALDGAALRRACVRGAVSTWRRRSRPTSSAMGRPRT